MELLDSQQIGKKIIEFLKENPSNSSLFAGAGVGVNAGLMDWKQYLQYLTSLPEKFGDNATSQLMQQSCDEGDYSRAAEYYKLCNKIPIGDKYELLGIPFSSPSKIKNLTSLISLPFSAIFTTNFDRALHDAYSLVIKKAPLQAELYDESMKSAIGWKHFFIARLHGSCEVAGKMVLADSDFKQVQKDSSYIDLISYMFSNFNLVFIGFSFLDPAICHVLQFIGERVSPYFLKSHIAFLPDNSSSQLSDQLINLNIKPFYYSSVEEHKDLWEGIKIASQGFTQTTKINKPEITPPYFIAQRYLSMTYATLKNKQANKPLRDLVIDGIIEDLLTQNIKTGLSIDELARELQKIIRSTLEESKLLVKNRISHFSNRHSFEIGDDVVSLIKKRQNPILKDLEFLSTSVADRLIVRSSYHINDESLETIRNCIEDVIIQRGWDLSSLYLGSNDLDDLELSGTINRIVLTRFIGISKEKQQLISMNIENLFSNPDSKESTILSYLARVSFALQLVLNSPTTIISQKSLLPENLYLDCNVLLPLIVVGHPFNEVYVEIIASLIEASQRSRSSFGVYVLEGFLNEVLGHKNNAKREIQELNLEDAEELEYYIKFNKAENVNVFIAAYASFVGRMKIQLSFSDFLKKYAPYEKISELQDYISRFGIKLVDIKKYPKSKDVSASIYPQLLQYYTENKKPFRDVKKPVLIRDEADQLAILRLDIQSNVRSLFVTADTLLKKVGTINSLLDIGNAIFSHIGLIQFVDLIIGVDVDSNSTSRLLWGYCDQSSDTNLINYFTALALKDNDEVKALFIPELLERIIPEIQEAAKNEGVSLLPGGTLESKSRTAKFLDRFEDNFYKYMAELIKKRSPDSILD